MGFREFQVNEYMEMKGDWSAHSMEAVCPFPKPCPMHSFHLAIPELYSFRIN